MLCAISGEAPQEPVVSTKSGSVYEKRLIETYITENGTEPSTGEQLTVEDLVALKAPKSVRPRPPTLTSIPSLLGVFQEEWDALALETYTLRQNLAQTRQDLSNALYQHDAAIRVIARLTKERDEAREALAKVSVQSNTGAANGDSMHIDPTPLPPNIIAKIDEKQTELSKTRRKRPVPAEWASSETLHSYSPQITSQPFYHGSTALSVHHAGDLALVGSSEGVAGIYSTSKNSVLQTLNGGGGVVTDALWAGDKAIISTSKGKVAVFTTEGDEYGSFTAHTGSATSIALHPTGDILASVGKDQTYVLYDLQTMNVLTQIPCDAPLTCTRFHPDGHLLAAGGIDGKLRVYETKSGTQAAAFDIGGALKKIMFSENGIWLGAVTESSSVISIWDIRKQTEIQSLQTSGHVDSVDWDYTGQFVLSGGAGGITVHQYSKQTKEWTEPFKLALATQQVAWGQGAGSILTANAEGVITTLA